MRLGEKQELFARLLPGLLNKAHELGYDVRIGEVLRFEQQARWNASHCRKCHQTRGHPDHPAKHRFKAIGIVNSLHRQKLAVDLILCRDGRPCWDAGSYLELNLWWEDLHELCATGRRWGDSGHFSLTHGGRK